MHRDIKPSNIIFVGGVPKLADVGLVAGMNEARSYVGTEGFIPPEGPGSPQADLYSLGIVLYEMSTGKSHQDFPEPLPDLAAQLDHARWLEFNTVIHKACRAEVRQRYQTAGKMHADLELLCAGHSVKRLHLVERRLALLTRIGKLVALLAVVAAGVLFQMNRERNLATQNLVRLHVTNGTRLMNEGDLFGSLLSFTEALRLDRGDAKREESHRIRIACVLRQCPKLVGVFVHETRINQAAFSPDSRSVITASDDNTAQVWDLATGTRRLTLPHRGPVLSGAFSPDAKRIATTGADNTVHFWNAETGKSLIGHPIHHVARYDGPSPQFSLDSLRIITVVQPKKLQIWNVATGEAIGQPLSHDREVTGFTFSPDGRQVFTVGGDNRVRLWDATTGKLLPTDFVHDGLKDGAFSPDGRILATGGHDNLARLWDVMAGKEILPPLEHQDWVTSVAFSPESDRLVTVSRDNTIEVWDLATQPSPLRPLLQEVKVFDAHFSPDGRRIITASQGNLARMWDADSAVLCAPLLKHDTAFGQVLFSSDGHLVLTLQRAEAVRVWDLAILEPPPLRIPPTAVYREDSLSSNGQFKSTISSSDNTIRTFEVGSGKSLTQPLTQKLPFRQAFFGSDNAILVTENADSQARVWDLATGEPLTPLLKTSYDLDAPKLSKAALARNDLPAADLVLLAQLLSGSQLDETGGIRPFERGDVKSAWDKLKRKYPEILSDSAQAVFAWHDQEARACEQAWDWWPALFHLKYLLAAKPNDHTLQQRYDYARLALDSARKKTRGHREQMREIPPRDPLAASETADLSDYYNLSLKTASKNDLADLPAGLQTFGGRRFDVRGILHLSSQIEPPSANSYPPRINGIKIGRKCKRLHFLHATSFEAIDGTRVGNYLVHYADDQTTSIPIVYGKDVRDWWTVPGEPLDTNPSALIWMGTNPHAQSIKSRSLRLFKSSWVNLRPDMKVVSIDLVSSNADAVPFLVAVTTE
ncbi:MAG: hypothetical protein HY298_13515 [Verrucomicrobia bacterium]|nr:hypothetical protein [Verrucomicrobiota bacterium]